LPSGWAERVRSSLADPGVVGGAFAFAFDETSPALRLVEWGTRLRTKLLGRPYGDQAIFARRAVLDALGGVPQAALMEDLDLVRRLRSAGRLALLPDRVTTSARRYRRAGVWRTVARHQLALLADALGVERSRIASWLGR
jgi:hypothetical protein